jgi:DNA-binding NarL/FixJ family response regulator
MDEAGIGDSPPETNANGSGARPLAAGTDSPLLRKIRVFLVEDHPVVRKEMRTLLDLQPDTCVCGEAAGLSFAAEEIPKVLPHLVVVDLSLEDGDGFELMDWICHHHPQIKRLVFTLHRDWAYVERAFNYGAHGYVVKGDGIRELIHAIRRVMQDQHYISRQVTSGNHSPHRTGNKT